MERTKPVDAEAIEESLAIAGERAGDLTPSVYALLFERHPQMEALFWRDGKGLIRGEMLMRVFEAILDFIGERRYADHMIEAEVLTHEGYDVPREVFATFFGVVAERVEEACGPDWTPIMADAWLRLLRDLDAYVNRGASAEA
jgi:hemoglobin-like flavoprotein